MSYKAETQAQKKSIQPMSKKMYPTEAQKIYLTYAQKCIQPRLKTSI